jgi:aminoglycoside 6'-N-acetyltransferase-1b/aminoglycoside 6'-N-acetyltransferase-2
MTEADLPMLHAWLNRPHVAQWWGGEDACPSLDEVRAHHLPRVLGEESALAAARAATAGRDRSTADSGPARP